MHLLRSRYAVRGWWICVEYAPCLVLRGGIIKVPEVAVRGVAASCAGEGYACHNVWSAFGEVQ
jgi:hypothetical protein